MEESCAQYASLEKAPQTTPADRALTIALGLPIVSSKTKYDGEVM
jgi:hypothetical protein